MPTPNLPMKMARTAALLATTALAGFVVPGHAWSAGGFIPDTLVVSRVHFVPDTTPHDGETYPEIFNDPNVSGIQGTIFLDTYRPEPFAPLLQSLPLTALSQASGAGAPIITTSFSSKSEGSLHLSVDGRFLTYMGYNGAPGAEGVSNSETTLLAAQIQPLPAGTALFDRAIALVKYDGSVAVSDENYAFSGDNPRGAITVDGTQFYMAGNADSTENKTPAGTGPGFTVGVRYGLPGAVTPGTPNSTQLATYLASDRPDESTKQHVKDNNWRGIGIFNDAKGNPTLYVSKGSGGNGDDGIFQVVNNNGSGLPMPTTPPTPPNTITQLIGDQATNPATGASSPLVPFAFFFANPTTLYVADEGNASIPVLDSSGKPVLDANGQPVVDYVSDPLAGLQKWVLVGGVWQLEYVLQDGLHLNEPQTIWGYPVPTRTTGLRNMTGKVNGDGTVTLYAITAQSSEISGGEPDPTELIKVTDVLAATHLPLDDRDNDQFFRDFDDHGDSLERFVTLQVSRPGDVFRGVAFAPSNP
ncbi:MAG TPA: hypothetical protein VN832_14670 [Stellaceae bacterium]|nr:hypothetical protein [Stellaceae bacterium]